MSDYVPHGYCYLWDRDLILSMMISDCMIAAAYFLIPVGLFVAARRRLHAGLPVWPLMSFGMFIVLCGGTHVMGALTIFWPIYWLEVVVNYACALASVATFAAMLARGRYERVLDALTFFDSTETHWPIRKRS